MRATVTDPSLPATLAAIVGATHVLTAPEDMARYEAEWRGTYPGAARAVVRPATTGEVSRVVAACAAAGACIVPQGGNTGLVGGSTPDDSRTEVVLSLERMRTVRRSDPLDNTLTVEAGCTVLAAQEAAASVGRLFPLSLASEGSATVGGVVSTNAGGEQVLRYGNTRDLVLGLEAVLADGRVLNLLGALRKDNTGYDLKQLFIGGEGTLGIVTAVTFKLFARPRNVVTAWVAVRDPRAAVELLSRLTDAVGERVTAFELIGDGPLGLVLRHGTAGMRCPLGEVPAWSVLFDVSEVSARMDPAPAVEDVLGAAMEDGLVQDAALAASDSQAHAFWALREHVPEAQRLEGPSIKHDIAVAISRIPQFIGEAGAALQAFMPGVRIVCFGHVGDGNLHYNQSLPPGMAPADFRAQEDAIHDIVHATAARLGGSISAEHGIGRQKQQALLHYKSPVALEAMARIKRAMDPRNTFNPGRMLPRALVEATASLSDH
ncbi:FAD-binding oxidoreductase [Paracidovorax citrulli]|uniref:4-phosphoerythronate dehydrogenase (FAD-dependent) n=2 Tax=Paracidovorax citrulli TaxID=80869 RepID=A1TS33_PARC0|nr:FAD-binding oxidoreductase [Paracidovorax citrulli]ABM33771.1 4-phosphoerythronate dehydrogenase (FAD-dependent) [Paracidovorax citrulli AAC00-1]ATG94358.1 FAD-binding oxidoreductase [Paracidovorax citrulli]PVY63207.1 FAD/FMN-containing dehydrogenase [Paracidovorax citrulli]REG67818.1 FAD/FMN-containing dehydrogenase [Paracidovorax citrulli]RLJ92377.1 FAD/FMN-containing dehydrogenase [Paracidovorax citrulli]